MRRARERQVAIILWTFYGVGSLLGLGLLSEALFISRSPQVPAIPAQPGRGSSPALPVLGSPDSLASKAMTRRISAGVASVSAKAGPPPLESVIRLSGIMDFGGKQPSLAVIEVLASGESKAYRSGDRVADTGVRVGEIGETVIVEFEKRRFQMTPLGIQELPAQALGSTRSERAGD